MAFLLARSFPVPARAAPLCGAAVALVLAGCGATAKRVTYEPEEFGSTTTHTRNYEAT